VTAAQGTELGMRLSTSPPGIVRVRKDRNREARRVVLWSREKRATQSMFAKDASPPDISTRAHPAAPFTLDARTANPSVPPSKASSIGSSVTLLSYPRCPTWTRRAFPRRTTRRKRGGSHAPAVRRTKRGVGLPTTAPDIPHVGEDKNTNVRRIVLCSHEKSIAQ